jgi:hypothetical protein
MKLKLIATIFAIAAIPALVHAQQGGPQPKPTKADAQNVVQIITSDKVKTQAYCDIGLVPDPSRARSHEGREVLLSCLHGPFMQHGCALRAVCRR